MFTLKGKHTYHLGFLKAYMFENKNNDQDIGLHSKVKSKDLHSNFLSGININLSKTT